LHRSLFIKKLILALIFLVGGATALADEKATSSEEKAWCAQELKSIDQHYHQPKLKNPDSKSICVVVQALLFQTGTTSRVGNFRPIQQIPVDKRKPFETDIFYMETAIIEAMQHSQPVPYPKMPIKPNRYWMITYTRDPSKNPPTKLVLEQSYLH
jgi:hypothetical protein